MRPSAPSDSVCGMPSSTNCSMRAGIRAIHEQRAVARRDELIATAPAQMRQRHGMSRDAAHQLAIGAEDQHILADWRRPAAGHRRASRRPLASAASDAARARQARGSSMLKRRTAPSWPGYREQRALAAATPVRAHRESCHRSSCALPSSTDTR